ncbi:hypothetical protein [Halopenitus persicus]|uniref:hypothetical protein n=1 Tax=Halopenitus persicus TaxID=1048396 RepID=UPI000BBA9294|nr:hypothetical protein [Halopenitus persicus]
MSRSGVTRRRLLASIGVAAGTSIAGCDRLGTTRYAFRSAPADGTTLTDLFGVPRRSDAFHYDRVAVDRLIRTLRETGRVTTLEEPLLEALPSGQDGYVPAYLAVDGTYHRIRVAAEPATFDRWVVWMEPLPERPADATVAERPRADLSATDRRIVDRIARAAVIARREGRDQSETRAYRRGVVFFDPLNPDASDLVPDPPFRHALIDPAAVADPVTTAAPASDPATAETTADGDVPAELPVRLHVAPQTVGTTRYVHALDPVTDDPETFRTRLESEHVAASFDPGSLSAPQRDVIATSLTAEGYHEREPISDAFDAVLSRLEFGDRTIPAELDAAGWRSHYEFGGAYYAARLWITDSSIVSVSQETEDPIPMDDGVEIPDDGVEMDANITIDE